MTLSASEMTHSDKIEAKVTVTNTGNCEGTEVVQLYIRDLVGSVTRPVKELKGFERVTLKAGESRDVTFTIDADLLKFYNGEIKYVCEPGDFEVMIGTNSADVQSAKFALK